MSYLILVVALIVNIPVILFEALKDSHSFSIPGSKTAEHLIDSGHVSFNIDRFRLEKILNSLSFSSLWNFVLRMES